MGTEMPLTANSALELITDEIVTGDPAALSVPLKDALDPAVTLPKFNVADARANCPGAVSLPESPMFSCGFDASEAIARLPETAPDA